MIPLAVLIPFLLFGFVFTTAFGLWRGIIEVDLIEDLWKNVLKTKQTIANNVYKLLGKTQRQRTKPWDFDWDFYQYIHALFFFSIAIISFSLVLPLFKAFIFAFAFVWWYGVVLDCSYFLIRMRLTGATWKDEISYMSEWVNLSPIPGFITILGFEMPLWYVTNVFSCLALVILGTYL